MLSRELAGLHRVLRDHLRSGEPISESRLGRIARLVALAAERAAILEGAIVPEDVRGSVDPDDVRAGRVAIFRPRLELGGAV